MSAVGSVGVGVAFGVLVWIGLLTAAIILIVKGARGRKKVPRVAVEGRVVQGWQLGGNSHTIEFDYPPPETEAAIVARESGLGIDMCRALQRLAVQFRSLKGQDLEEGASTRLLVACATLIAGGMKRDEAILAAISQVAD